MSDGLRRHPESQPISSGVHVPPTPQARREPDRRAAELIPADSAFRPEDFQAKQAGG